MTALGNDYVYIDCVNQTLADPEKTAVLLSNRHYGSGSDGMVLICPSERCDFRMRIFNGDGTEAEMCGNAIRSVGKYLYDYHLTDQTEISIETLAGDRKVFLTVEGGKAVRIQADVGAPILEPYRVPVDFDGEICRDHPLKVLDREFLVNPVSVGNPHSVAFVDDVFHFDLEKYGPAMEMHPFFPERVNAEFATVRDAHNVEMRVWERSTGETLACSTGCCVTVVGGYLTGRCSNEVTVHQPGGPLDVFYDVHGDGHIYVAGPSRVVFDAECDLDVLLADEDTVERCRRAMYNWNK